jgi:hypothetical protein
MQDSNNLEGDECINLSLIHNNQSKLTSASRLQTLPTIVLSDPIIFGIENRPTFESL